MHFGTLDWIIVLATLAFFVGMVVYSTRYSKSVADFLAAGRSGGRYMMTMASGMVWIGAINVVAMFELYHNAGFTPMWWVMLTTPFVLYLNITGFGVYRFRETRALTVAQFLESRYDRPTRVLAGILAWIAGMVNFGLFPIVGARFFVAFCGFPQEVALGGLSLPTTTVAMALLLGVSLFFVFGGGQVSVMLADCLQGIFMQIVALVLLVVLLVGFLDWGQVSEVIAARSLPEEGKSLVDPFHAGALPGGFTGYFFIIGLVGAWYTVMSNMPSQAYVAGARSGHEYRMGAALNQWRWQALLPFFMVLVLCASVVLYHPEFAGQAAEVRAHLDSITAGQPNEAARQAVHGQMVVSSALAHVIPGGLAGLLGAVMLVALISTYDSFLHTWGSVFVQDVVLPFRRRPLPKERQLRLLRSSIVGVALFALLFSLYFPNTENILMFFALMNNLWLGGSGIVILGGLYWKRGSRCAALSTLVVGAVLGIAGIGLTLGWPERHDGARFPVDPQWWFFLTILISAVTYLVVSVVGGHEHDMERMLHRGPHHIPGEEETISRPTHWHERLFGIMGDFPKRDRVLAYAIVGWFLLWLLFFLGGTLYAHWTEAGERGWLGFWHVYLWILAGLAIFSTVWFTAGGISDIRRFFHQLRTQARDDSDDGFVK